MIFALAAGVALAALIVPASATASTGLPAVPADILGTVGGFVGGVFSGIGHAVLGAFSWTIGLASKFILTTIAALVRMLIPRSWATEGVQIMQWIVAVPDYAGKISTPGGAHAYGFAGINELRSLFTWIGVAMLPLSLVYATSRAMLGQGAPVGAPLARVLGTAAMLLVYPYAWGQGAALVNQLTHLVLSPTPVASGLHKLMLYAVGGVALGGWQLIDLGLMAAIGLALLGLIFLKVALILLGALLFATGPLMIGVVAADSGHAVARAWVSATFTLLALPVAWATVFAVGAVLIDDAGTAAPLIGGASDIGHLLGGLLLAISGLCALWLCLRAAKEAGGLLRVQLAGLLALAGHRHTPTPAGATGRSQQGAAGQVRAFQTRVGAAVGAAGAELAASGPRAALAVRGAGMIHRAGRRGLVGTAARAAGPITAATVGAIGQTRVGARARRNVAAGAAAAALTADGVAVRAGRAGAIAARMARAGTASWQNPTATTAPGAARPAAGERGEPSRPTANGSTGTSHGAATINGHSGPASSRRDANRAGRSRTGFGSAPGDPRSTPPRSTGPSRPSGNPRPAPPAKPQGPRGRRGGRS
ncbi:MAG: hypothetical protein ACRET5_15750 [Steroidobacteraceae bacterium]